MIKAIRCLDMIPDVNSPSVLDDIESNGGKIEAVEEEMDRKAIIYGFGDGSYLRYVETWYRQNNTMKSAVRLHIYPDYLKAKREGKSLCVA